MSLIRINSNPSRHQLLVFGFAGWSFWNCWSRRLKQSTARARMRVMDPGCRSTVGWFFLSARIAAGLCRAKLCDLSHWICHFPCYSRVIYYVVFVFIGLIMRLLRYDPLTRRFDARAATYWRQRSNARPTESYFRQS